MSAWKMVTWGAAAAGCMALALPAISEEPAEFSHKVHVKSADLECNACHAQKPEGMTLKTKVCANCHDDGTPAWKLEPKAERLKIAFPHEAHTKTGECTDCHKAVLSPKNTEGKPMAALQDCQTCHEQKKAQVPEASCALCHGTDERKVVPADHKGSWLARHGEESQDRVFGEHGKDCKACHGDDACVRCHRDTRPKSHTGLWRVRTHGTAAAWDRDSCKTCHETGSCARCHASTKPMNHTAAWRSQHGLAAGTTGNESCLVCHRASQCASCHRQGGNP